MIALVLGAVVNVLVTWGIVFRFVCPPAVIYAFDSYGQLAEQTSYREAAFGVPSGFSFLRSQPFRDATPTECLTPLDTPVWGGSIYVEGPVYTLLELEEFGDHSQDYVRYVGTRVGWPLRSMRSDSIEAKFGCFPVDSGEFLRDYRKQMGFSTGIRMGDLPRRVQRIAVGYDAFMLDYPMEWQWSDVARNRPIPLKPIPVGFACNALFYSIPFLGMFIFIPWWKRQRRRRRGLCHACAYDRGDLAVDAPCPECGANPA